MPRKSSKTRSKSAKTPAAPEMPTRRETLRTFRNGALGALVLGGIGVFSVNAVRATIAEQDLSVIGTGLPTIVQIHDPQCTLCIELQRETRKALEGLDSDMVAYRIASIRTPDGTAFAHRHGQSHVTLVLLEGAGAVQQILQGVRPADELRGHFDALIARDAPRG
ncbi:hypothetical protein [Dinoroseobacter sp. S375]|uniref:hypothetical protein n=1 Tax=Dinoroseobacter sp. S375 TaxID=3415136 RepID=UPI003C7B9B5E